MKGIKKRLNIGAVLVAKSICHMLDGSGNALIVGKEYEVKGVDECYIILQSEIDLCHYFSIYKGERSYWGKYFNLKK